jgi:type II secretory pathway component PulF
MVLYLVVIFLFVGGLLLMMAPDIRAGATLPNQLRWHGWTTVLIVIGVKLNLGLLFILLVVAAPMLWMLARMDRTGRQSSLIWTLAIAVKRGLPLRTEVEALANGMWGRHRLRLQLLSENLAGGVSLSAALERQPGLIPPAGLMLIRIGEETGCLGSALESYAVEFTRKQDRQSELIAASRALMVVLFPLIAGPYIVGFVCYYVLPKFKKIFEDFGTELPGVTMNFIYFADWFVRYFYLTIPLLIGAIVVLARVVFKGDLETDWPLMNLLAPRINGPPVLRSLALLTREQRPLAAGVEAMSWSHPQRIVRRKLEAICRDLEAGRDLAQSLAEQRFIYRGDVALLKTAERVRNLPWVMEQLAEQMEQKLWYRLRLLLEFVSPIGVFLMGMVVLFVAAAFFMPLIKLLNDLS